jgi:hypothetical protein
MRLQISFFPFSKQSWNGLLSRLAILPVLVLAFTLAIVFHAKAQEELRIIKVRIAADEEFRKRDQWGTLIRERFKAVSDVFESNFYIRFEITDIVPWESSASDPGLLEFYQDMQSKVSFNGAELVMGFSAKKNTGIITGLAKQFGNSAVIPDRVLNGQTNEELTNKTSIHELLHIFGMFHVQDKNSIMYFSAHPMVFDDQTRRHMQLMRDYDFRHGVIGINEAKAKKIQTIYGEGHADDGSKDSPFVSVYLKEVRSSGSDQANSLE